MMRPKQTRDGGDATMGANCINLAIVGMGMAAKPHLAALNELQSRPDPKVKVGGIFTRSRDKAIEAEAMLDCPVFEDLDSLAKSPDIDAILLLTPPDTRIDIVSLMAQNGKHILAEKPIERDLERATEIVEICEKNNIRLGLVFQHRYRAGSKRLRELINYGALGDLSLIRTDVPWWRPQSYYDEPGRGTYERDGGGVMITQAIHVMDLMLSLTAPVTEVQAFCATTKCHRMEAEDFVAAGLTYADGAVGSVVATTATWPNVEESIAIDGSKGSARLQRGSLTLHWRDGRSETVEDDGRSQASDDPMDFPYAWHRDVIEDFAQALQDGRSPGVSGREGLKVQKLIEALELSSHEGSKIKLD